MIDRAALLADLKRQVGAVEKDLDAQLMVLPDVKSRLHDEWATAKKLGRTAATETSWRDDRITQVAVAWVLATVFVRFCEDNQLIPEPYLTGPANEHRELAHARYETYVASDPNPSYRGWLERAFAELGAGQAGKLLFDPAHNPLYQIPLSHDGAGALIEFWRERDEHGVLVHDFTDPLDANGIDGWDTRFLGDLYQDLSEDARETYALFQTPEFVEEFILDRTLEPAIREFGYEQLEMIDPCCGSGHFVLGAFRRIARRWAEDEPTKDRHERVRSALNSVHGVDINLYAIAIARFRLSVAAMAAANMRTLAEAANYEWPIQLAVGDSLIKARQLEFTIDGTPKPDQVAEFSYATEDVLEYPRILEPGRYHVVVGNPPYPTVKDKNLNALYRALYKSCFRKYALSVPFAERFFELAKRGGEDGLGYGLVGQITANSFTKRDFGARLIEQFFRHSVELTEVIDTSGAYIPGHGTPTVILVGTRRSGKNRATTVRTVRSVQGEPKAPERAEDGLVWRAIIEQIDRPGSVSRWVSVDDLDRERYFSQQPWILLDGGLELVEKLTLGGTKTLANVTRRMGVFGMTNADDIMLTTQKAWTRRGCSSEFGKDVVLGDELRDWSYDGDTYSFFPYTGNLDLRELPIDSAEFKWLWPGRTVMGNRATFSKGTYFSDGRTWYEWHQTTPSPGAHPWTITFAFVATHNHFVLDRGGKVFKQSAPVIKLPEGASEDEHLRLLGLLNSSTACFWLKMVSYPKGGDPIGTSGARVSALPWADRYEFTTGNLKGYPLPASFPTALATSLDSLGEQLNAVRPAMLTAQGTPSPAGLREAAAKWRSLRARMIALQEELDWRVYTIYKLLPEDLCAPEVGIPELAMGERAFEIVLARRIANGEATGEWFVRHNSTPITEIPAHWPDSYRQVVQRRIDVIESNRAIGMIERPEYKRRWATEGWDVKQEKALRSWLLDRMESHDVWFGENDQPAILTLSRLTDRIAREEDFVSVATLYAPRTELSQVVADLITDEHVPFLAALRYKPSSLKKHADWEQVWELQRDEDAAVDERTKQKIRDEIPVPKNYAQTDFLRPGYWHVRGKLDVPKERFISYSAANVATPDLYGWAGWDHLQQAQALATYFTNQSLSTEEITPLLAGLLELQPWLSQWHDDYDDLYSGSPAAFFAGYRKTVQGEHGLTDDDLRGWPAAAARGRRGGTTRSAAAAGEE